MFNKARKGGFCNKNSISVFKNRSKDCSSLWKTVTILKYDSITICINGISKLLTINSKKKSSVYMFVATVNSHCLLCLLVKYDVNIVSLTYPVRRKFLLTNRRAVFHLNLYLTWKTHCDKPIQGQSLFCWGWVAIFYEPYFPILVFPLKRIY